jgi:hypothetical protein
MESESMRIDNIVFDNLIMIDDWGEEAKKNPGYENMSELTDWQKKIIEERRKEFHKNREQVELEEGIRRRYLETEDFFLLSHYL